VKNLSDCRVLLVDDAKANLDILVEGLKADHKLSLALNGALPGQPAASITASLLRKVRGFAGSAAQSDDIAIMAVKLNGKGAGE
jgi:hypothetical protein